MIRTLILFLAMSGIAHAQQATSMGQGDLRVLDKLTGDVTDVSMRVGSVEQVGLLRVSLQECRAPSANPNGDAYALMSILYREDPQPAFQGWMIASAPALNAMDHPRYDVWVLRCSS